MYSTIKKLSFGVLMASTLLMSSAFADEVNLMNGVTPRVEGNSVIEAGKFKKVGPWTIGMSHFGVNANTWTVQMAHESESAAAGNKDVGKFILLDANIDQAKQVADIEDLIAQKVDAIIVTPLTPTSADAGIAKAVAAGIPVIVHTGLTESDKYTLDIQGGGENFGKVMGDFLVKQLGGKGNIWVLRGLPGHPEDINRYKGLLKSIEGTTIKIVEEDTGNWQYDNGKKLCETFYLKNPKIDGIWSSGADMTRACVDVFKQFGTPIPPITGENNNGYFGQWIADGFPSISAEYGPEQGAAGVRAAIALLEGKEMHKRYIYEPAGWDLEKVKKAYRPDLTANVWYPTSMTEEELQKYYANK